MDDIKRIYSLLSHSNGLKIRAISQKLELDKYYVAEIMFSTQNIPYWYQDDDSLWYAKEGALQIEEQEEEIDELIAPIEIPQRFNINRFLEEDLSDSMRSYLSQISKYRVYSNDEMIELFKRYRNGDQKAFDMIIKSQQRLVANIALFYCRKGVPLEDIIQEGNVGLVKAAERFDYTQYRSFSNYAKSWIFQAISLSMTSMPYMVRLPLNQLNLYRKVRRVKDKYEQLNEYSPSVNDIEINEEISLEQIKNIDKLPYNLLSMTSLSDDLDNKESDTNTIDDYVNKNEADSFVKHLLCRLHNKERHIIQSFYGISTREETLSTIGDYWGLTRERVRQIKEKTLRHLREYLKHKHINFPNDDFSTHEDNSINDNNVPKPSKKQKKKRKKISDVTCIPSIPKVVTAHEITKTKEKNKSVVNVKAGDILLYMSKLCTVIDKTDRDDSNRLVIRYENGIIDDVKDEPSRYKILLNSEKIPLAKAININVKKLESIFDNKSTSYKYFWFMAIISLAKERNALSMTYNDILIRMATLAWPIIIRHRIRLSKQDMLDRYLMEIAKRTHLNHNHSGKEVESFLTEYYYDYVRILSPLLNNVPYRFLSPWIKYSTNIDVAERSQSESFDGPYALYENGIKLNSKWWNYISDHYTEICFFSINSFTKYLLQYNSKESVEELKYKDWSI